MTNFIEAQLRTHDFYRCYKCGRLITALEEYLFFRRGLNRRTLCACGSMHFSPANPPGPLKRLLWQSWLWWLISPLYLVPNPYVFAQGWLRLAYKVSGGRLGW